MKQSERALQLNNSVAVADVQRSSSPASLSEQDVLDLQHYTSPGFHIVKVKNHESGRYLLTQFQPLLYCYSDKAVLSTQTDGIPPGYHDLYGELLCSKALKKEALEEYLLCSFGYDFLVIEGTQDLLHASWFGRFEHLLIEYGVSQTIPVILFFYE